MLLVTIYSIFFSKHLIFIYTQQVPGVSMIRENHNPATWMLEVTSLAAEAKLGIDFAQVYKNSALYK